MIGEPEETVQGKGFSCIDDHSMAIGRQNSAMEARDMHLLDQFLPFARHRGREP